MEWLFIVFFVIWIIYETFKFDRDEERNKHEDEIWKLENKLDDTKNQLESEKLKHELEALLSDHLLRSYLKGKTYKDANVDEVDKKPESAWSKGYSTGWEEGYKDSNAGNNKRKSIAFEKKPRGYIEGWVHGYDFGYDAGLRERKVSKDG